MYLGHFHFENGVLYYNIKGHAKPIGKYNRLVLDIWESEAKHIKKNLRNLAWETVDQVLYYVSLFILQFKRNRRILRFI